MPRGGRKKMETAFEFDAAQAPVGCKFGVTFARVEPHGIAVQKVKPDGIAAKHGIKPNMMLIKLISAGGDQLDCAHASESMLRAMIKEVPSFMQNQPRPITFLLSTPISDEAHELMTLHQLVDEQRERLAAQAGLAADQARQLTAHEAQIAALSRQSQEAATKASAAAAKAAKAAQDAYAREDMQARKFEQQLAALAARPSAAMPPQSAGAPLPARSFVAARPPAVATTAPTAQSTRHDPAQSAGCTGLGNVLGGQLTMGASSFEGEVGLQWAGPPGRSLPRPPKHASDGLQASAATQLVVDQNGDGMVYLRFAPGTFSRVK